MRLPVMEGGAGISSPTQTAELRTPRVAGELVLPRFQEVKLNFVVALSVG
jgi:hypothetical protein